MFRDRLHEALRIAAAPTLERIREDRERLPHQLSKLMAHVEAHLHDPELNVKRAMAATKVRNHSLPALFRAHTDTTLRAYIEVARLEIADRLLRRNEFEVGRISMAVGYGCHATFLNAYKAWAGELPSEVGAKPGAPEIDYPTWRKVWHHELDPEHARDVLERYVGLYPETAKLVLGGAEQAGSPLPRIVVDAEHYLRSRAEEVWREIRDLALEDQRRRLRCYEFRSTALFDLLREKSRQEGRLDRRRGIDLARLALVSLKGCEDFFGDRIHDLRALGHAWLGNAHAVAVDFPAADAAFDRADEVWRVRRPGKDHKVFGEICLLKGKLRMLQRSYEEALDWVNRGRELLRSPTPAPGEIQCVMQCASIQYYAGRLDLAIAGFRQAEEMLDQKNQPYLAYAVAGNLATCQAKAGRHAEASLALNEAKLLHAELNHPLGLCESQYIDGFIQHSLGKLQAAESLYVSARYGFIQARELMSVASVTLDLMILYADQDRWPEVPELASEAVPMLQSLQLYPETLSAVRLLARAVEQGEITSRLLREVRRSLERDPVANLSQAKRVGNFLPTL